MKSIFPNSMMSLSDARTTETEGSKVTVVMRTKNRPVTLARAFASVLSQTHEDWHLYVVNDGGERKPVDNLIETYCTAFKGRVTVIHHEQSKGMEAASNAALVSSQSDFIVIHDDDDSWHPEFLEKTTEFLLAPENKRYAAVATYSTLVYERIADDRIIEEQLRDWYFNDRFIEFSKMVRQNIIPSNALLVRRLVARELGYFNESLPVLGDWDFNLRLMSLGDISVIPRHLAYYHCRRTAGNSMCGNTVTSGLSTHELYNVLYQNCLLRESLRNGIAGIAPLSSTLQAIAEIRQDLATLKQALQQQTVQLQQTLQQTLVPSNTAAAWLCEALGPIRWIWLKTLPLRRCIAKLRERI